ncbi:MAG TPA: DUF2807 domain-containing protein [Mucilaginibacter sp.]|jgi:hypothetical protein|nr:DUF2807 domain-containing protein [Mucilaginibacter sp.]
MKKTILTIAIAAITVFGISRSAHAATTGNGARFSTMLTGISNISEIEVHGNVKLYVTTGDADQVKVYNDYYAEDALVQEQNGVLRITSYETKQLEVWVTVTDLSKLTAYDNAEIKSFGKFSSIDLNLALYNRASAQLDIDAYSATVSLNDRAMADLSGTVTEGDLKYARSAYLNTTNFAAAELTETVLNRPHRHFHPVEFAAL